MNFKRWGVRSCQPEKTATIQPRYRVYWLASQLSRRLPLAFAYWVGLRCADLFFRRDRIGRANVRSNLRRIYAYRGIRAGDDFLWRMARKTYQFFGKYLVDFFRYSIAAREEIERRVTIAGFHHYESAVARGRGVILVSAHLGNWEMGGLVLALRGHALTTVYRAFGNPRLDRLFDSQRSGRGLRTLPLGHALRDLVATLRNGGTVALLADRDFSRQLKTIPFFGAPAALPRGPSLLAIRTRACIVPAFAIRQVDDHYLLQFDPPIDPLEHRTGEAVQQLIVDALESVIGIHPHQWFIFDDFWAPSIPEEETHHVATS